MTDLTTRPDGADTPAPSGPTEQGPSTGLEPGGPGAPVDRDAFRRRPEGATDGLVEAVGTASEGFEYLERARGHLFSFHQLTGRADILFGDAAELLDEADHPDDARRIQDHVVGRNVLDGRWTFQIVEEFDVLYYQPVLEEMRRLERELMGGRRHVHESEMKEARRTRGRAGHEMRPLRAHTDGIETLTAPAGDDV